MIKKLNTYFICDEEDADNVKLSDMLFFYGIAGSMLATGLIVLINII